MSKSTNSFHCLQVIEHCGRESLDPVLNELVPVLTKGYDNTESSVRKAAVFCLVALYMVIGDELRPYLTDLSGSKVRGELAECTR